MKLVHSLVVALVSIMATSVPAVPQTGAISTDALQAARDLVALVSAGTTVELANSATAEVWPSIEATLKARNPRIDSPTLADLRREFSGLMAANIAEVMKATPAIYARYFTVGEMQEIIAFYRSPAGAKTLKVMPQIMTEVSTTMAPQMQTLQEKVSLAFLNLLQKRGLYAR